MFKLTLKNVWSRKGRLLLTAIAVIAGTAFLSGVFVFTDTIKGTFDRIFTSAYAHTDAVVRSVHKVETLQGGDQRARIDAALIDLVAKVPGVSLAEGDVDGQATITKADGTIAGEDGPPKFGGVFSGSEASPWAIKDGKPPVGPAEVVVDAGTAKRFDIAVGDHVTVTANGVPGDYTVVGTATFGGNESTGGSNFALFALPTAQQVLLGNPDEVSSIVVRGDGTLSQQQLADRVQQALGRTDVETRTGKQMTDEAQTDVQRALSFITIFLSIFALISLFVGSFIIYNVFSISAAQRQRENALLRAIGASRSQVTRAQFGEAFVVGLGGSLLGLLGGLGLAAGILKLMAKAGIGLADSRLVVKPAGFVVSLIVGVVVTLLCAIAPALRSGRVPPVAAMRDVAVDRADASHGRRVAGAVILGLAVVAVIAGLTTSAVWLGLGVVLLFVALIALGPIVAGPIARLATAPLGTVAGTVGMVAGRNAARSPKRTALTAGALGVGLALLIGVATLGSSAKESIHDAIGKSFVGDFTITPNQNNSGIGIPSTLAEEINASGKASALGLAPGGLRLDANGDTSDTVVMAVDPQVAADVFTLPFTAGGFADLTAEGIIFPELHDHGLTVGDSVQVTLLDGTRKTLTVQGIFDSTAFGSPIVARDLFAGSGTILPDLVIFVRQTPGVTTASAQATLQTITDRYPTAKLQSRDQYIDDQSQQIDGFLNFIYALLGMSLFIAVIGIVITLSLAVYERRHELGLVRAVGMTRPQVRRSIVWESVVTALIGIVMGTFLGVTLGWIVVKALEDQGLSSFALPLSSIIVFIVSALALAAVAAFRPAWKGSRADILDAIATT